MPPSAQEKAARLLTKKHDDSSRARSTTHSRSRRWLQGARRLLFSGHYVLNILLVSTYLLLRWRYSSVPLRELQIVQNMLHGSSAADWASWERLAGAGCGTGALRAIMRARSMDGGAAATLRYAQVHVLVMSLLAHRVAFAYYALAFLLLFLAFSQPEHSGRDDRVQLHPERLAEYLRLQVSSPAPSASSTPPPPAAPPTPTTAAAAAGIKGTAGAKAARAGR